MRSLYQDLRYSLRQLIKSPGFTLTAVASLALGIGASTAVFSVIYAGLLHPYPYRAAERIVPLKILDIEKNRATISDGNALVLSRPDQHVAWRGNGLPADAMGLIDRVRGAAG